MRSIAVVVPREEGERARRSLASLGMLRRGLRIEDGDGTLLLPVKDEVSIGYPLKIHEFKEMSQRPRSYRELLEVPEELRPLLPRAHDIVGDVLILKIHEELASFEEAIGSALLKATKSVATVAVDEGVSGHRRRRTLRVIIGRRSTRTVHREYGLKLAMDPSQVYFSPRMAGERRRVAQGVRTGEVIIDAFCGVGPFALHMARQGAGVVYAVDVNPSAIEFLRENVRRNHLENVAPIQGDVRKVLPYLEPADRVVLDFPKSPLPHFTLAASTLKEGGILHYYEILERDSLEERLEDLSSALPRGLAMELLGSREVRGYSPSQGHYALDLKISTG
ncbi:MAG: class I SAM-dependent methyltransferase family protein [Candidatus Thermoplasmatota archaeon]|nr:class I SAM-dependent methyltransferase family protein [Candidatus Thermoplasmatota archaeon]